LFPFYTIHAIPRYYDDINGRIRRTI